MKRFLSIARSVGFYLGVTVFTGVLLLPGIVALSTSFKTDDQIFSSSPSILPTEPTLRSYERVLSLAQFPHYLLNSLLVASITALVAVGVSLLAAYALRFLRFRGRDTITEAIMLTYMFPAITLVIPMFFLANRLGLLDSLIILVLADLTFTLPIGIWLLTGFFERFPAELERAARVDGCTRLQVIWHVLLPVMRPAIVAVGAFAFILAWGEYLFSITLTLSDTYRTASAGLHSLMGNYRTDYALLTAASALIVAPVLVVFGVFQRYIVEGLTADSLKQ